MGHCRVEDAQTATEALRCHIRTAKQSCETLPETPVGPGSQRSTRKGKGCSGKVLQEKPSQETRTSSCSP